MDGGSDVPVLSHATRLLTEQLKRKKCEPWETRESWCRIPPEIREALIELGSAEPDIYRRMFVDEGDAAVFVRQLRLGLGETEEDEAAELLWAHRLACSEDAEQLTRRLARTSAAAIHVRAAERLMEVRLSDRRWTDLQKSTEVPRGTKVVAAWPTALKRTLAREADPHARVVAERLERDKWVSKLGDIVSEADLPLARAAADSGEPEKVLSRVGQGRRARTVRKRVYDWLPVRSFLLASFNRPWPLSVAELLAYVEMRAAEPCTRTALKGFLAALSFVERAGGIRPNEMWSGDSMLKSAVDDATTELASTASSSRPRRQAPREPIIMLVRRERCVVDLSRSRYRRMYCWWKCVKVWDLMITEVCCRRC